MLYHYLSNANVTNNQLINSTALAWSHHH